MEGSDATPLTYQMQLWHNRARLLERVMDEHTDIYCCHCESRNHSDHCFCGKCGHPLSANRDEQVDEPISGLSDKEILAAIQAEATNREVREPVHLRGSEVLATANGLNGRLELTHSVIRIIREGGVSFLFHGFKGDKEILISHISSIQFKRAGVMKGYIQFAFVGGAEAKGGLFEAGCDENSVMFNEDQQQAFEIFRDRLQPLMSAKSTPATSLSDLETLASLRAKGIVSEQEFQAKKRQILGL